MKLCFFFQQTFLPTLDVWMYPFFYLIFLCDFFWGEVILLWCACDKLFQFLKKKLKINMWCSFSMSLSHRQRLCTQYSCSCSCGNSSLFPVTQERGLDIFAGYKCQLAHDTKNHFLPVDPQKRVGAMWPDLAVFSLIVLW